MVQKALEGQEILFLLVLLHPHEVLVDPEDLGDLESRVLLQLQLRQLEFLVTVPKWLLYTGPKLLEIKC